MSAEWRPMRTADLDQVMAIAEESHPELPEDRDVVAEKLALFPRGCFVLEGAAGLAGYAISHPSRRFAPPELNRPLRAIPEPANDYYVHDVVVSDAYRGGGHAAAGIGQVLAVAADYETTSLVSVYGTTGFWARFGFAETTGSDAGDLHMRLRAYGSSAAYMLRRNHPSAR